MPCNARVVQYAKIAGVIPTLDKLKQIFANHKGTVEVIPGGYRIRIGPVIADIDVASKKITLRSYEEDWDTGVKQLQHLMKMIQDSGLPITEISQPETHRHDHVVPWQQVSH